MKKPANKVQCHINDSPDSHLLHSWGVLIYTSFLTVQLPNLVVPDYYSDRNNRLINNKLCNML